MDSDNAKFDSISSYLKKSHQELMKFPPLSFVMIRQIAYFV